MGFTLSRADLDLWLKLSSEHDKYEYIATYVDDIIIVTINPTQYLDVLADKFSMKHIETNPKYYLGNNLEIDDTKRMKVSSKTYISEVIRRYEDKYGSLRKENVPSTPNDHPELDDISLLNETGITRYQSNIGICQ